jgi:hypothetical protein
MIEGVPADMHKEVLFNYVKTHFWATYRTSSSILSSTCRQLALAVGGICWLIKSAEKHEIYTCQSSTILILIVLFFIFDAAQYLVSAISYKNLAEKYDHEIDSNKITEISELIEPSPINAPPMIFFSIKLFCLMLSAIVFIWLILKI